MKLLKKTMLTFGLAALFGMPGPVQSASSYDCCYDPCYDPCNTCDTCMDLNCDWCEGWTISADYLYWATRKNNLIFALPYDGTDAIGGVYEICPRYDSGFRIGLMKECGDVYFAGNYTWYQPRAHNQVTDPIAGDIAGTLIIDDYTVVSQGSISVARGSWKLDYNSAELLAGYNHCFSRCVTGKFFGGFKAVFLRQNYDALYASLTDPEDIDTVFMRNKLDAYGAEIGTGLTFKIFDCLDFFGNASFDVLVGQNRRSFTYVTTDDGGVTETIRADLNASCARTVGIYNFQFGFTYHLPNCLFSCCRWDLNADFSFGYELHNWINAPGFLEHTNESGEITVDDYNDALGIDGLFARFTVNF